MPRVAAKDQDEYFERRRTELLDAALRLLARESYDKTSVAQITREAGVSKGTFYLYFRSKDELLDALVERFSLLPAFRQLAQAATGQPIETIVSLAVPLLYARLKERSDIIGMLLREGATRPATSRIFLEQVLVPGSQIAAELFASGLAPERAAQIDCVVAARALVGMLLSLVITQEVMGGRELVAIEDQVITKTITELFLHGALGA